MSEGVPESCRNCGERSFEGYIRHQMFCYDFFILSAKSPGNQRDDDIDKVISEQIVAPLEEKKYLCFHGCRDQIPGEHFLTTVANAIRNIPITIVPIYNRSKFSNLVRWVLDPDFQKNFVLIIFDAPKSGIYAFYNSLDSRRHDLLITLMKTSNRRRLEVPHETRKALFPELQDTGSTNSACLDLERPDILNRFDITRRSIRKKSCQGTKLPQFKQASDGFNRSDPFRLSSRTQRSAFKSSDVPSIPENEEDEDDPCHHVSNFPLHLLKNCSKSNQDVRTVTRWITQNMMTFYRHQCLQKAELHVRHGIQSTHACDRSLHSRQEQLHFWTLVGIFMNVYMENNVQLKSEFKQISFTKQTFKQTTDSYEDVLLHTFQMLSTSLYKKIQTQSQTSMYSNKNILKKLQVWLDTEYGSTSYTSKKNDQMKLMTRHLRRLPWDIRHLVVVIISEKLFQNQALAFQQSFLYDVCTISQKKHSGIFLEITERATEYILDNHTKGAVDGCLQLLVKLWKWCVQKTTIGRKKRFKIILKHSFELLVYHPLIDVRNAIVPLLFSEDEPPVEISRLGSQCILANQSLVEDCIRKQLTRSHSGITMKIKREEESTYLIFDASTREGDALLYLSTQQTLNDILLTNSTDDSYERFQEMGTIVKKCQHRDHIATLRKEHLGNVPYYFVLENGKPLLQYLHESENQHTLLNMVYILQDIAKAVSQCHEKEVILRNITPASFIVFPNNGSESLPVRTKLVNFQYAKMLPLQDTPYVQNASDVYENNCGSSIEGEHGEALAVCFSAPESLRVQLFSKSSDTWMVAATFYSVLLYGRNPFVELDHLRLPSLIDEILKGHDASNPSSIPSELWKVISINLNADERKRMSMETLLKELESYKLSLGPLTNEKHVVNTRCSPIGPEDISMGYFDENGIFKQNKPPETSSRAFISSGTLRVKITQITLSAGDQDHSDTGIRKVPQKNYLHEEVSIRMNLRTRSALLKLNHDNLLKITTIIKDCLSTKLISDLSDFLALDDVTSTCDMDLDKLLTYYQQIISAIQHLHSKNILHCDLRCCSIYVNCKKGLVTVANLGRAICLKDNEAEQSVYRMMPADAKPWSAPEVTKNGTYSKASDVYSLAAVFCEAHSREEFLAMDKVEKLKSFDVLNSKMAKKHTVRKNIPDALKKACESLAMVMKGCWDMNPTRRSSLETLSTNIECVKHEWLEFRCQDNSYKNLRGALLPERDLNTKVFDELMKSKTRASLQTFDLRTSDETLYEEYESPSVNYVNRAELCCAEEDVYDEVASQDEETCATQDGRSSPSLSEDDIANSSNDISSGLVLEEITPSLPDICCKGEIAPSGDPLCSLHDRFDKKECWGEVIYEFRSDQNIPKHVRTILECKEKGIYDDAGIKEDYTD
ncbi:uncharacterized protein LOC144754857 isoform X2 [Lissotriton helveticus]